MGKYWRRLVIFLFFLFPFLLPHFVFGKATSYFRSKETVRTRTKTYATINGEQIKDFVVHLGINKDGTVDVREKIIYDFGYNYKHGIYRYIPFIKENKEGEKFILKMNDFSVNDEKGNSYPFTKITENDRVFLKIGKANKMITGLHTYIIHYKVEGALTYFSDHSELYWNATGNDWSVPINHFSVRVVLPGPVSQKTVKEVCYAGIVGDNSSSFGCQATYADNGLYFLSKRILFSHQGVTVAVSFPKNWVAYLPAEKYIPFAETFWGRVINILKIIFLFFWYVLAPGYIFYRWWRYGRDPKVGKAVTAWYDPPKLDNGRFLTPTEVGGLVDERVDPRDIFAMVIYLAQRGYFKIEERKKKDFYLVKKKDFVNDQSLLPFEKRFLHGLFDEDDQVRIKDKNLNTTVSEVNKLVYQQMVDDHLFPKNPQKVRTMYHIIMVVGLITGNIFLFLAALIFGRVMPRKTKKGAELRQVALSLKNFLASQERQLKFQAEKKYLFEKLLPFAIAFGVEKIWAKRFAQFNLDPPDWYQSYDQSNLFSSYLLMNSLQSSFSAMKWSITPTSSSSGFSSGFSGGFSGGGGGGGGGGSW